MATHFIKVTHTDRRNCSASFYKLNPMMLKESMAKTSCPVNIVTGFHAFAIEGRAINLGICRLLEKEMTAQNPCFLPPFMGSGIAFKLSFRPFFMSSLQLA